MIWIIVLVQGTEHLGVPSQPTWFIKVKCLSSIQTMIGPNNTLGDRPCSRKSVMKR